MPRYYFHLHNSTGFTPDEEGRELADLAAARRSAIDDIRSILCADVKEGYIDFRGRIEIVGEGDVLTAVPFAEAVELRGTGDIP